MYTPGVEMIPVTAFRLEPLVPPGQHPGHLTVDGELVPTATIQVQLGCIILSTIKCIGNEPSRSFTVPAEGTRNIDAKAKIITHGRL